MKHFNPFDLDNRYLKIVFNYFSNSTHEPIYMQCDKVDYLQNEVQGEKWITFILHGTSIKTNSDSSLTISTNPLHITVMKHHQWICRTLVSKIGRLDYDQVKQQALFKLS